MMLKNKNKSLDALVLQFENTTASLQVALKKHQNAIEASARVGTSVESTALLRFAKLSESEMGIMDWFPRIDL